MVAARGGGVDDARNAARRWETIGNGWQDRRCRCDNAESRTKPWRAMMTTARRRADDNAEPRGRRTRLPRQRWHGAERRQQNKDGTMFTASSCEARDEAARVAARLATAKIGTVIAQGNGFHGRSWCAQLAAHAWRLA
ncbi:hypothetical protein Scep_009808 [Stephania cephalantha]|uniref:Uncharacterized protein n=1 Tax=Stephania cephalantha TaxID=152367 RepID=A0AAP0JTX5_9MAGN